MLSFRSLLFFFPILFILFRNISEYFSGKGDERSDQHCTRPYEVSAYAQKLVPATFFRNNSSRTGLDGIYRTIKNIKPSMGVLCSNLMFLEKTQCPSGILKNDPFACANIAEEFCGTLLNFPQTKSALSAILRKLLLEQARHYVTTKKLLSGKFSENIAYPMVILYIPFFPYFPHF